MTTNTINTSKPMNINISESISISSMNALMSEFNNKVDCIQAFVNTDNIPIITVSITGLLTVLGSYTITYHNADNSDYNREIDLTLNTDTDDNTRPIIVFYDGIAVSNPVQLDIDELLKLLNNLCFNYHEINWSFTANNSNSTNTNADHIIALMKLAFALSGLFKYEVSSMVKPDMVNPLSIPMSMPLLINWIK